MEPSVIGIDLGGTNIRGVVMEKNGCGRHGIRVPTEAHKGGPFVLNAVLDLINTLVDKEGSKEHLLGIGIGTPGYVSEEGVVYGAVNLPGWHGTRLRAAIEKRFGLGVVAANDASVMALAEATYGAGRGARNLVCYTLGTGIGGGIVIEGKLYNGSCGMAGELGHVPVEPDGIPCACGQRGCVERYASASGIAELARMLCGGLPESDATPFSRRVRGDPSAATSRMVYDYIKQGDAVALRVHERACDMLARAVGISLSVLSPDRVVLGGGVMAAGRIIIDEVTKRLPRYCWSDAVRESCAIVAAQLGEEAGALGAAALVFDMLNDGHRDSRAV